MKREHWAAAAVFFALGLGAAMREAEATPAAIKHCTTITASGSYVLKKSLTHVGTCIVVAADFVTLDLDGQTLQGNGTGSGISDGGFVQQGTVVRNGTVTNFATGIDLFASTGSVIERVRAIRNGGCGIVVGGDSTLSGNTAQQNGGGNTSSLTNCVTANNSF
jgi:parallel beta-helix repeat protein